MDINIDLIRRKILEANEAYITDCADPNAILTDEEYDYMVDLLKASSPEDPLLSVIGHHPKNRMGNLPIPMASIDKIKSIDELYKWANKIGITEDTVVCISAKYDGISIVAIEETGNAWTRGDGKVGQKSDAHFKIMNRGRFRFDGITFGEAIMSRDKFVKYSDTFKNPRNFVSGKINSDTIDVSIADIDYVRYGYVTEEANNIKSKAYMLDMLGRTGVAAKYACYTIGSINEELLMSLYKDWSADYNIDGLVIEVDEIGVANRIGRHPNGNPKYMVAYKGKFESVAITCVNSVEWNVSKSGALKPVIIIDPVELDGVEISRVTGYNAKNIFDSGIGTDAIVEIKRSGFVIPKVVRVLSPVKPKLPSKCPSCGWTITKYLNSEVVDVTCDNKKCSGIEKMKILAFFNILGVEHVSEGIISKLYDEGYNTVKKMLMAKKSNIMRIQGFGDKLATKIVDNIRAKTKEVSLSRLQHASSCFEGLGELTLDLINAALDQGNELRSVNGIGNITIGMYNDGVSSFKAFYEEISEYITVKERSVLSHDLDGWVVVMTGFRNHDLKEKIISRGGRVSESIAGTTTHLLVKIKGSGSAKEKYAKEKGIPIYMESEFIKLIG